MKELSKRDKIMDSAEELFSQHGYHGVSVRDITKAADVRLASVNYYFETKHGLYWEILARRGADLLSDRRTGLSSIELEKFSVDKEAIRSIIHAWVDPILKRVISGDRGWRAYASMLANHVAIPLADGEDAPEMHEYDAVSIEFIEVFKTFSLDQDDRRVHNAFQSMVSASLIIFANNGRVNTLSENRYRSDDYHAIYQDGIDFIVAGVSTILLGD